MTLSGAGPSVARVGSRRGARQETPVDETPVEEHRSARSTCPTRTACSAGSSRARSRPTSSPRASTCWPSGTSTPQAPDPRPGHPARAPPEHRRARRRQPRRPLVELVLVAQRVADAGVRRRVPLRRQHRRGRPPDRLPRARARAGRALADLAARVKTGLPGPRPVTLVVTMADLTTPQPAPDDRPQDPSRGLEADSDGRSTHTIVIPPDGADGQPARPARRAAAHRRAGFPQLDVRVRGNEITLSAPAARSRCSSGCSTSCSPSSAPGSTCTADAVERSLGMLRSQTSERPADVLTLNILSNRGRTIRPKTLNQKRYVDAIDANTIVFGIGPAGTGKTYLAMAKAVQALQAKQVNRIILTRPAVEAGERLGFLPGTLTEKIDPYLRPLYDALHDMIDPESIPRLMAAGTIEVAPLAYMRGRSLNDAFIILDEAQNTSPEQMKMFLTRLGFGSQMVVTGDVTQIDLPERHAVRAEDRPGASWTASTTSTSRCSPATTSSATGWSARSSTPTAGTTRSSSRWRPSAMPARGPAAGATTAVTPMSIEVNNETDARRRRARAGRPGPARARRDEVHPQAELSVILVDEVAMERLHVQWMDLPGPTDVMSFPMDELRPGQRGPRPGAGAARRHRALPERRRAAGPRRRSRHRGGAAAPDDPRHPAPARLRPRRAGGGARDVRPAAQAAADLPRGPGQAEADRGRRRTSRPPGRPRGAADRRSAASSPRPRRPCPASPAAASPSWSRRAGRRSRSLAVVVARHRAVPVGRDVPARHQRVGRGGHVTIVCAGWLHSGGRCCWSPAAS